MRLVIASDINMHPFLYLWDVTPEKSRYNPSWTMNLIEGLKSLADIELHIVSLSNFIPGDLECDLGGLHYHFIKTRNRLKLATLYHSEKRAIAAAIRRIDPDLVHAHADKVYALGALKSGYPFITTVHALQEIIQQYEGSNIANRVLTIMQKWLWAKTRFMICVSPYVRDHVVNKARASCRVIENAISDLYLNKSHIGDGGNPALLFIAGVSRRKNLDGLLKAMSLLKARYPTLSLTVIGVVPEFAGDYYTELEQLIAQEGLGDKVRFLGHREPAEIAEIMVTSTMLVHPSKQETFGMVVAEAMALGLPVVTSNNSGMSFLVEDRYTGLLVDPEAPHAIAAAIARLLDDPGLRWRLAANARKDARERFQKDIVAQKHYEFYKEILSGL